MKYRLLAVLLLTVMILAACGAASNSIESSPESSDLPEEYTHSTSFDLGTKQYSLPGMNFLIPRSWELSNNATNNSLGFITISGWLAVAFYPDVDAAGFSQEDALNLLTEYQTSYKDVEPGDIESFELSGSAAYKSTFMFTEISDRRSADVVVLSSGTRVYRFTMCTYGRKKNYEYYSKDYQKILESIQFIEDVPEETAEEEPEDSLPAEASPEPDPVKDESSEEFNEALSVYFEGQYWAGHDIPAGEYVLYCDDSKYSGYFSVSTDANGDNILFNDNFGANSIITIKDGEFLELSRCYAVHAESVEAISADGEGMFRIGQDLEPGTYKLISDSKYSGYYCIYSDSRHDEILSNDIFESQSYVTVSDGQYLLLSRCRIETE